MRNFFYDGFEDQNLYFQNASFCIVALINLVLESLYVA